MARLRKAAEKAFPIKYEHHIDEYGREVWTDKNSTLRLGFKVGYKQCEEETIERACKVLFAHLPIIMDYCADPDEEDGFKHNVSREDFIKFFRAKLEEDA